MFSVLYIDAHNNRMIHFHMHTQRLVLCEFDREFSQTEYTFLYNQNNMIFKITY